MLKQACALVLLVALISCGGSNTSTPTPTTPTPATTTVTVTAGTYSTLPHFSNFIAFSTPTSGRVTITLSWLNSSDTLWLDTSASCTSDQYVAGTCQFVYSDRSTVAIAQKTAVINSLPAGSYVLIIDSRGPSNETITYEVDLTS